MAYQRSAMMEERLAENRQRILTSARHLVAQGGFRMASITAVAETAGISTGAIYRYFPSKAALFVEVLQSAVDYECQVLDAIVDGEGSATARLRAAVESFVARALKGPYLAYAFIAEPVDPEVEAARLLCRRQFSDVFKRVLREGIASGEFPKQSVDVSAACIVGAFTEALVRPIQAAGQRKPGAAVVRAIVDFCERAVTGPHAVPLLQQQIRA